MKFLTTLSLVGVATALTAPSTQSKFTDVLSKAKLQYPDSSTKATSDELLDAFVESYFQLDNSERIQFQISGSSKRTELREMEEDGSNAEWRVDDSSSHTAAATIKVPTQESGIKEVTMMQIHGGPDPILRISWVDSITIDGTTSEDVIISTVRTGLGDDESNFVKTVLNKRSSSAVEYVVTVKSSKLTISVNGSKVVSGQDLSFWDDYTAYFKAGAYNNNPSSSSATAEMLFNQLSW